MAKKRTVKPFYGKKNQRLEAIGTALMKQGKVDDANEMFKLYDSLLAKRKAGKT